MLIAVATIGFAACVTVNETLTGRDIDCTSASDDVCVRAVDLAEQQVAAGLARDYPGRRITITVAEEAESRDHGGRGEPDGCAVFAPLERVGGRCWRVLFMTSSNEGGIGVVVLEQPDGTLIAE